MDSLLALQAKLQLYLGLDAQHVQLSHSGVSCTKSIIAACKHKLTEEEAAKVVALSADMSNEADLLAPLAGSGPLHSPVPGGSPAQQQQVQPTRRRPVASRLGLKGGAGQVPDHL